MEKARVLYLCGQSPWLCNSGALIRNYWMISALSRRFIVDLVTAEEPDGEMPAAFRSLVDAYACFPRRADATSIAGRTSPALRDFVAERLGRFPYAAIQVDLPMHAALPRRDAIPIVYNAHRCEYELVNRRARVEPPHLGVPLALDALRIRWIEGSLIARATLVAACSESDVRDFERFWPAVREKAAIVPNGIDVEWYAPLRECRPDPRTVLVSGNMEHRANIIGLRWFLREVLPKLRQAVPGVRVRVAGRMRPPLARELAGHAGVEAVPNPPSMVEHLTAAAVVAAPIVAGGGTCLRILEAWAASRPVVTTVAGACGLRYEDGVELFARDNPLRFAYAISRLLADPLAAGEMAAAARARVAEYDWRSTADELLAGYDRVVEPPRRSIRTVSEEVAFSRP